MSAEDRGNPSGIVEAELDRNGFYASNTFGISMRPLFKTHRDAVIIKKPEGELRKYDVALYPRGDGKYSLHRVIAVRESFYLIRGDNTYVKERIPKTRVIGVMTAFNRKGKQYNLKEFSYKAYVRLWNFIYPVRYLFNLARRMLLKLNQIISK